MGNKKTKPTPNAESNELLDQRILVMLRRGTKRAVVGGEVQEIDLSAADLEFCRKRLKDIGLPPKPQAKNPIVEALARLRQKDAEERAAATGLHP